MLSKSEKTSVFGDKPVRETAAASLLVVGRLAILEYCEKRGHDASLLIRMQDEAVAAWVTAWGCDTSVVEDVVSNIHASLACPAVNFDTVRANPQVSTFMPLEANH